MSKEGSPKPIHAPETTEVQRRLPITLDQLLSETPIHGLGYERFNEAEQIELRTLLSRAGAALDSPWLRRLDGETILDIIKYVRTPAFAEGRRENATGIVTAIKKAMTESFKAE